MYTASYEEMRDHGIVDTLNYLYDKRQRLESLKSRVNRLTPIELYMGRTAPLTSKRCILYIY